MIRPAINNVSTISYPSRTLLKPNNPALRFAATASSSSLPPQKPRYVGNSKFLDGLILKLMHWAERRGWDKLKLWLHLKRFPQWQAIYQWAQATPFLKTKAGGIALLPEKTDGKVPLGLVVVDGIPRMAGSNNNPRYSQFLDGQPNESLVIWCNSNLLPTHARPSKDIKEPVGYYARAEIIRSMVDDLTPRQAKDLLLKSLKDFIPVEKSYGQNLYCVLDLLCEKVAQEPGLMPIDPKWMLLDSGKEAYFVKEDGIAQGFKDLKLFESMGYVPVFSGFRRFAVPTKYEVRKKLEAEGKIPEWKAERWDV